MYDKKKFLFLFKFETFLFSKVKTNTKSAVLKILLKKSNLINVLLTNFLNEQKNKVNNKIMQMMKYAN